MYLPFYRPTLLSTNLLNLFFIANNMDSDQTAPKVRVYHICSCDKISSEVHLNIKQTRFSNFFSFAQSFAQSFLFEVMFLQKG